MDQEKSSMKWIVERIGTIDLEKYLNSHLHPGYELFQIVIDQYPLTARSFVLIWRKEDG